MTLRLIETDDPKTSPEPLKDETAVSKPVSPVKGKTKRQFHGDVNARPPRPAFNGDAIPDTLKTGPRWVAWRYNWRNGCYTKLPLDAVTGDCLATADTSNPDTWGEFAAVRSAANVARTRDPLSVDGLGRVFCEDDGIFGIDIDSCRDPETGVLTPLAVDILRAFATYAEVSPSGMGIKLWGRGSLSEAGLKRGQKAKQPDGQEIEVYDDGRYFTVTGQRIETAGQDVTDCRAALAKLQRDYFPSKEEKRRSKADSTGGSGSRGRALSDMEVIERITKTAKNAAAGAALWAGSTTAQGGDDSAADLALCNLIAFYTGPDVERIDTIFRASGLMRDKWERSDYRGMTIRKAIEGVQQFYDPKRDDPRSLKRVGTPPHQSTDAKTAVANPFFYKVTDPHILASGFLGSIPALRFWRGDFHIYQQGAYHQISADDVIAQVTKWVRAEFVRQLEAAIDAWKERGSPADDSPTAEEVTTGLIANITQAIKGTCLLPGTVDAPSWIDGGVGPDPTAIVSTRNGIVDIAAAASGKPDCVMAPTPAFFTPVALPFAFDPNATNPTQWLNFLSSLWPEDPESIQTLREWFGYCLTADTRFQKILFLLGPKRAGKGTIARVLTALLGAANVAGPTAKSLSRNFGLQPLIGKTLAIIADMRPPPHNDTSVVTERLLSISGEDTLTIDRKFREPVTMKLVSRIMIMSNELPRLEDSSGALASRLVMVKLNNSFLGKEDHRLTDRLMLELPGILIWAIEGYRSLHEQGRFTQPASAETVIEELHDLSSPVAAFVRDCCELIPEGRVETNRLFNQWKHWCDHHGRRFAGTAETFGKDLRAAIPGVDRVRARDGFCRGYFYKGIALDPDFDGALTPPKQRSAVSDHWNN
ncbi:MAG: hypothetical protein C0467_15885 [Planctomycetaceae bacterium]|nr:hypothetical protein [Planctomycetaceae bacterium]